jgi:hypothetical protein
VDRHCIDPPDRFKLAVAAPAAYNSPASVGLRHLFYILLPGVGQVMQDRHVAALLHFFFFALFIDAIFMSPFFTPPRANPAAVQYACGGLAALSWLVSAYDYLRTEGVRRRGAAPDEPSHG